MRVSLSRKHQRACKIKCQVKNGKRHQEFSPPSFVVAILSLSLSPSLVSDVTVCFSFGFVFRTAVAIALCVKQVCVYPLGRLFSGDAILIRTKRISLCFLPGKRETVDGEEHRSNVLSLSRTRKLGRRDILPFPTTEGYRGRSLIRASDNYRAQQPRAASGSLSLSRSARRCVVAHEDTSQQYKSALARSRSYIYVVSGEARPCRNQTG